MKKEYIIISSLILFSFSKVFAVSDIQNHWAENEINTLIKDDIIQGYADDTFRPNNNMTVSEFLKVLIKTAGYKLVTVGNEWPDWYIETAKANGLILENEFQDLNANISRKDATKIISRYINLSDVQKGKNKFTDLPKEEKEDILKLVKLKVINGYEDNTFKPDKLMTRAEACKVILNAYNAKNEIMKTRKYKITNKVTNILGSGDEIIENRYEIKKDRLYFYDKNRYANLNGQTLNQEYINDKKVIKTIERIIDDDSYLEVKFVPDKYIINSLNLLYGKSENDLYNGAYIFEIKLYENAYYNVAESKGNEAYIKDAFLKIKTGKMWDKNSELENDVSASEKNLYKLEEAIGAMLDDSVKDDFIDYIKEKRIEAGNLPNESEYKIAETKKIGKYTINTFCMKDKDIEIFVKKI